MICCTYIDVCSPDWLSDHHNRDNELLLAGCPTLDKDELRWSLLDSIIEDQIPKSIGWLQINAAVTSMVDELFVWEQVPEIDGVLVDDPTQLEDIYVYAYLSW